MGGGVSYCEKWGNVTRGGGGGLLSQKTLYKVQQGDFHREQKDEERAKGGGGTWGGGGRMGETEGNCSTRDQYTSSKTNQLGQ